MKLITEECYAVVFGETIELKFGSTVVEHRKPKVNETELEVAISLIKHYKHNGAYKHYLWIERLVEGSKKPLKEMKSDEAWHRFKRSEYYKALEELEKKVYDTSLNEMWRTK